MIERIKNIDDLPAVIELIGKIKRWDLDLEETREYLTREINNPCLLILLDKDRKFTIVAEIKTDFIKPYCMVWYAYSENKEASKDGWYLVKRFTKEWDCDVIRALVKKNIGAFDRVYGFKPEAILVKREV